MSSNRCSPFAGEMRVDIVEKVVDILHCHLKVLWPQFKWKNGSGVEFRSDRQCFALLPWSAHHTTKDRQCHQMGFELT